MVHRRFFLIVCLFLLVAFISQYSPLGGYSVCGETEKVSERVEETIAKAKEHAKILSAGDVIGRIGFDIKSLLSDLFTFEGTVRSFTPSLALIVEIANHSPPHYA